MFSSAARIRAQRATSSSRVMVTFFITLFSCNTNSVSNGMDYGLIDFLQKIIIAL